MSTDMHNTSKTGTRDHFLKKTLRQKSLLHNSTTVSLCRGLARDLINIFEGGGKEEGKEEAIVLYQLSSSLLVLSNRLCSNCSYVQKYKPSLIGSSLLFFINCMHIIPAEVRSRNGQEKCLPHQKGEWSSQSLRFLQLYPEVFLFIFKKIK